MNPVILQLEKALERAEKLLAELDPLSAWFDQRSFSKRKASGSFIYKGPPVKDNHPWPHLQPEIQARTKPLGSMWVEGTWQWKLDRAFEANKEWLMFEMQRQRRQMGARYLDDYMRQRYNPLMHPSILI